MSIFQRQLVRQLIDRLAEIPNYIQIVRGPRQTGKTTLVRQACEEIYSRNGKPNLFYAVDNPVSLNLPQALDIGYEEQILAPNNPDVEWLVYQWEKARSIARSEKGVKNGLVLVFDEIQKISNWSEAVKGLWDEDHSEKLNLHIVLLGSSPLLMQQGLSESLVGRYENLDSYHWSYLEMSEAFNFSIDEYVYFGGYPGAASFIRDVQRWKDYVQGSLINPYLLKDILVMARVDKPALLINAFELSCEYSGQIMALTKMKGQLQNAGNETTIANYLFLLSKAGLVTAIQKYSGSKIRQRASIPKLNVMNTGLMACYSNYTFEQAKADRTYWGRMVESAVGAHLLNTVKNNNLIYYWKDKNHEVDFVVESNKKLLAIEVKSGKKSKNLDGLNKFAAKYKNVKPILVGAEGISLQEFLSYSINHWID